MCDAAPLYATLWIEPWYEFEGQSSIFPKPFSFSGYDTLVEGYYLGVSQSIEDTEGTMTSSNSKLYTID